MKICKNCKHWRLKKLDKLIYDHKSHWLRKCYNKEVINKVTDTGRACVVIYDFGCIFWKRRMK